MEGGVIHVEPGWLEGAGGGDLAMRMVTYLISLLWVSKRVPEVWTRRLGKAL